MKAAFLLVALVPVVAQAQQSSGFPKNPGSKVVAQPNANRGLTITIDPNPKKGRHGLFADEAMLVGGKKREYRVYVPESVDLNKPAPLVFAYHGWSETKESFPATTGLDELAEQEGFILVYPEVIKEHWGHWTMEPTRNPDVEFFDALYAKITADYHIDHKRVYALGFSNGAYFSHVLASKRSEQIAAIASHSGGIGYFGAYWRNRQASDAEKVGFTPRADGSGGLPARGINARHKYAVLIIQGDADEITKLEEAHEARDLYKREGHAVEYLEVRNWPHVWALPPQPPEARQKLRKEGVSVTVKIGDRPAHAYQTADLLFQDELNARIWGFFLKHPLR